MRKLMSHHSGKLCFVVGGLYRASVYENKSTRKSKRVDGLVVHAVEFPGILDPPGIEMLDQMLPDFGQIGVHLGVVAHWHGLLDLIGRLAAELNVLLRSKRIDSRL